MKKEELNRIIGYLNNSYKQEIKDITSEDVTNINKILQEVSLDDLLEQIDSGRYDGVIEHKGLQKLSDLVLVHKTEYAPENGIIKTSENAGATIPKEFEFLGEKYSMQIPSHRETVHFSLNGEVTSHWAGDFDHRKYAVLIPFEKVQKDAIGMTFPVDTFLNGNVEIPIGGYVLCPQAEQEKLAKSNNNAIVIGYEGKDVDGYANQLLEKILGYKKEGIRSNEWASREDQLKLAEICDQNNIIYGDLHGGTIQFKQEIAKKSLDVFDIAFNMIKDKIIDQQSYAQAEKMLSGFLLVNTHESIPLKCLLNDEIMPHNYLFEQIERQIGISIPDEQRQEFYEQFEKKGNDFGEVSCLGNQLTEYVIRESRLQQISDLSISELSEFDANVIFTQKNIEISKGRSTPIGFTIDRNEKVGEFHKRLEKALSEQKNNVDIEALKINSENVSAQERDIEISKMKKELEKSRETHINEQNIGKKNEDWVM